MLGVDDSKRLAKNVGCKGATIDMAWLKYRYLLAFDYIIVAKNALVSIARIIFISPCSTLLVCKCSKEICLS